jgi:hypothetical protein
MAIWTYSAMERERADQRHGYLPTKRDAQTDCVYCGTPLDRLGQASPKAYPASLWTSISVAACQTCGWWVLDRVADGHHGPDPYVRQHRAVGVLRNLDLSDVSLPLEEVSRYLLARYGDRFHVHPRKYEEVVAGVFRDLGYRVRLTAYTGDDGVDALVLDGDDGDTIGVQVKRYRASIEASQIREFAGSLILNGLTQGVYVTTSAYRSGATSAADRFRARGVAIDLWDCDRFYAALGISRRPAYSDAADEGAPFHRVIQDYDAMPLIAEHVMPSGR